MKRSLNQKLISLIEYYDLFNANLLLSNNPIKRSYKNTSRIFAGTKTEELEKLKKKYN